MSIVHNGSKITECQLLALSIFNACACDGISLEIKCIPRNFNHYAELLSRTIDFKCLFFTAQQNSRTQRGHEEDQSNLGQRSDVNRGKFSGAFAP